MSLPESVRRGVESALGGQGADASIEDVRRVGGGCISPTARIETGAGSFFLKWAEPGSADAGLLPAEAAGLAALRSARAVRVPGVVAQGGEPASGVWLLLEWLEPGGARAGSWEELGRSLAGLHRSRAERYGWADDNYIGSLPQRNAWSESWPAFWRERRLAPQLERAYDSGHFDASRRARFDRLLEGLDPVLEAAEGDGASLLHGDLWSGNVHMLVDGTPAIIDPSTYHGHREVDLAMSELFGGFGPGFYSAYDEAWPIGPGYRERRRAIYQLYYLLVHVNLFGGGYVGRTLSALDTAGF